SDPTVSPYIPFGHATRRKPPAGNTGASNRIDLTKPLKVLNQVLNCLADESGNSWLDQLVSSAIADSEDRRARCHSLNQGQPERFGPLQREHTGRGPSKQLGFLPPSNVAPVLNL